MFLKLDKSKIEEKKSVYIFKFYLDWNNNDVVYKIGVTSREEVTSRLAEVVIGFFNMFRFIPKCTAIRFSSCSDAYGKEKELHKIFENSAIRFHKKFSGSSEFFQIEDEDELLSRYDLLVKGK